MNLYSKRKSIWEKMSQKTRLLDYSALLTREMNAREAEYVLQNFKIYSRRTVYAGILNTLQNKTDTSF